MHSFTMLPFVALTACAAPAAFQPGQTGRTCDAAGTDRFIGSPATGETGAAIMKATHSSTLRWAPPGVMLTMDFSPTRVTVRLGPDRKVTAINCG